MSARQEKGYFKIFELSFVRYIETFLEAQQGLDPFSFGDGETF